MSVVDKEWLEQVADAFNTIEYFEKNRIRSNFLIRIRTGKHFETNASLQYIDFKSAMGIVHIVLMKQQSLSTLCKGKFLTHIVDLIHKPKYFVTYTGTNGKYLFQSNYDGTFTLYANSGCKEAWQEFYAAIKGMVKDKEQWTFIPRFQAPCHAVSCFSNSMKSTTY